MRGKLRDKRELKRDHQKHEILGRRPTRRDNRIVNPLQQPFDDEEEPSLDETENELVPAKDAQN